MKLLFYFQFFDKVDLKRSYGIFESCEILSFKKKRTLNIWPSLTFDRIFKKFTFIFNMQIYLFFILMNLTVSISD